MPPKQTKQPKQIVCYTGVGAKASGIHSNKEFVKAAGKACTKGCPKDVDGLIAWTGARRVTPKRCSSAVKSNKRIDVASKLFDAAGAKFDACVEKSCGPVVLPSGVKIFNQKPARCGAIQCAKQSAALAKSDARYARAIGKVK